MNTSPRINSEISNRYNGRAYLYECYKIASKKIVRSPDNNVIDSTFSRVIHVSNQMRQPVYIKDGLGQCINIPIPKMNPYGSRFVKITIDDYTYADGKNSQEEVTRTEIVISEESLNNYVIYVKELDQIFYLHQNSDLGVHPLNNTDSELDVLDKAILKGYYVDPIIYFEVNDNTIEIISKLYALVFGQIVPVRPNPACRNNQARFLSAKTALSIGVKQGYKNYKLIDVDLSIFEESDRTNKEVSRIEISPGEYVYISDSKAVLKETHRNLQEERSNTLNYDEVQRKNEEREKLLKNEFRQKLKERDTIIAQLENDIKADRYSSDLKHKEYIKQKQVEQEELKCAAQITKTRGEQLKSVGTLISSGIGICTTVIGIIVAIQKTLDRNK